jgi:aspartate kinase
MVADILDSLVIPLGEDGRTIYLLQIGRTPSKDVETQERLLAPFGEVKRVVAELTEGCEMVSMIGHDYMQQPGLFLEVLRTLHEAQIAVLQTSDSDFSLSVLVPESETNRSVKLLHDRFKLAEIV